MSNAAVAEWSKAVDLSSLPSEGYVKKKLYSRERRAFEPVGSVSSALLCLRQLTRSSVRSNIMLPFFCFFFAYGDGPFLLHKRDGWENKSSIHIFTTLKDSLQPWLHVRAGPAPTTNTTTIARLSMIDCYTIWTGILM